MFEFDSNRKAQSVIIYDGSRYKLLVKGADSYILERLNTEVEQPYKNSILESLSNFSNLGYRTLVFAERYLTDKEYMDIEADYVSYLGSSKRNHLMSKL